ncbi:MAG: hypothetical protein OEX02_12310 [Cyclobacteriaceae bacterium]|nr:hypothetical protein [Cyclobacteriaceae bacterium]
MFYRIKIFRSSLVRVFWNRGYGFFSFVLLTLAGLVFNGSAALGQTGENTEIVYSQILIEQVTLEQTDQKGLKGVLVRLQLADSLFLEEDLLVRYTINDEPFVRRLLVQAERAYSINTIEIFHPFAGFFRSSGEQEVLFMLENMAIPDQNREFKAVGILMQNISVVVPTILSFSVKVNYVGVSGVAANGTAWDYNFFAAKPADSYPDLVFTIESEFNEKSRGVFSHIRYQSHRQKNTIEASWPAFSDVVYYCAGDRLSVCIKDVDTVFDDVIGCLSVDELKGKKMIDKLNFQQVRNLMGEVLFEETGK